MRLRHGDTQAERKTAKTAEEAWFSATGVSPCGVWVKRDRGLKPPIQGVVALRATAPVYEGTKSGQRAHTKELQNKF